MITIDVGSDRRGRAMGTSFHLIAVGGDENTVNSLVDRLDQLESRWSRFVATSDVSRLNAAPDMFHLVSGDTVDLVDRAVLAWRLTGGAFDPTVHDAVVGSGYDRTFDEMGDDVASTHVVSSPGCGSIEIDPDLRLIRLGAGVRFDPGGIGKGLAADLIVAEGLAAGLEGLMVNIGGDVVCAGRPPTADGWVIELAESTVSNDRIGLVALEAGAVVTSTSAKRCWMTGEGPRHHLVDPRTGRSTVGPVLVSVVAAEGWYAEAVAKQLMVTGDPDVVDRERAAAIVIDSSGTSVTVGDMARYLR